MTSPPLPPLVPPLHLPLLHFLVRLALPPTLPPPLPLLPPSPLQHASQPLLPLLLHLRRAPPGPIDPQPAPNLPLHVCQRADVERPQHASDHHQPEAQDVDRRDVQRFESFQGAADLLFWRRVGRVVEGWVDGEAAAAERAARDEGGEGQEGGACGEEGELAEGARGGEGGACGGLVRGGDCRWWGLRGIGRS